MMHLRYQIEPLVPDEMMPRDSVYTTITESYGKGATIQSPVRQYMDQTALYQMAEFDVGNTRTQRDFPGATWMASGPHNRR